MRPFYYNCLHDLISSLFIFTVEDITSRSQQKHVKLCSNSSLLLSQKTNSLFQRRSTIFQQASYLCLLCVSPSLFCSLRKFTNKNLPLVSCFGESKFCWQSAEIRLLYHLSSIYAKWSVFKVKWNCIHTKT